MFMTLISFLGGSAFRLIFGAVMDYLNKQQDHQHEIAFQKIQAEFDAQKHERDMVRIELQAKLGVQQVEVMASAAVSQSEASAFVEAVKATGVKSGVSWVDAWNQSIRPAGATIALLVWIASMVSVGFMMREFDEQLIAAFLGVFVGERIHRSMRK